jgi:drug/metabolite transporter (DMT)-like permease
MRADAKRYFYMSRTKIFALTLLAMMAFAGNSLLCRVALKNTSIDAASFTSIRVIAGALTLWLIMRARTAGGGTVIAQGSWPSAFALFAYAACFSFAYVSLSAATGALLLFGAVQFTMISYGFWNGERFSAWQWAGLLCAFAGLAGLLLPGLTSPPLWSSALMMSAGAAWGIYSLRGRKAGDATAVTAGNFFRAVPITVALSMIIYLLAPRANSIDASGVGYAIASGAFASGMGYAIWYTALRGLKATTAATVQLSVPVIAAVGGIIFLGEAVTMRLLIASAAILGGIALVIFDKRPSKH